LFFRNRGSFPQNCLVGVHAFELACVDLRHHRRRTS